MIIIRPITQKDTEAFIKIAFQAGIGMTSMPKNREILEKRVQDSEKAFSFDGPLLDAGTYLFVLEDLQTGAIGGTCGMTPKTGKNSPLSFYRIKKIEEHKGVESSIKIAPALHVVHHKNYWSEICSLYLTPDYRHSGLGRLLSFSRFLFIATFPERFYTKFFAEMRGHIDEKQESPFWKGIGQHFVDTHFETLMHLRDEGIVDLSQALPLHPIYIELLPKEVQESIGKIHPETKAALQMLIHEGFKISEEVDIYDGGPKIEVETQNIRSIKESEKDFVAEITNQPFTTSPVILSNTSLHFRACLSPIKKNSKKGVIIQKKAAQALQLNVGDTIRYVSPYKEVNLGLKE